MHIGWSFLVLGGSILWASLCLKEIFIPEESLKDFEDPPVAVEIDPVKEEKPVSTLSDSSIVDYVRLVIIFNFIALIAAVGLCLAFKFQGKYFSSTSDIDEKTASSDLDQSSSKKVYQSKIPMAIKLGSIQNTASKFSTQCQHSTVDVSLRSTNTKTECTQTRSTPETRLDEELLRLQASSIKEQAILSQKLDAVTKEKREVSKQLATALKENRAAKRQLEETLAEKMMLLGQLEATNREYKQNTKNYRMTMIQIDEARSEINNLKEQLGQYAIEKNILENRLSAVQTEYNRFQEDTAKAMTLLERETSEVRLTLEKSSNIKPEELDDIILLNTFEKSSSEESTVYLMNKKSSELDVKKVQNRLLSLEKSVVALTEKRLRQTQKWSRRKLLTPSNGFNNEDKTNSETNHVEGENSTVLSNPSIEKKNLEGAAVPFTTSNLTDEQLEIYLDEITNKQSGAEVIDAYKVLRQHCTDSQTNMLLNHFKERNMLPKAENDILHVQEQEIPKVAENRRVLSDSPLFQQFLSTMNMEMNVRTINQYYIEKKIWSDPKLAVIDLILQILARNITDYKCVAFIYDSTFEFALEANIFAELAALTSYFMVYIDDSEDMLSPDEDTQYVLRQIKNEGCQMHIVLLANAIQTSRLLRFGDRYRVLDTRSSFIFLHDVRLFKSELFYLWKRIINVIFIRQLGKTDKLLENQNFAKRTWFEITTVPFPNPLLEVFIPKRIDTWRNGIFRAGKNLFYDKTSDLMNQTMRVVAFQHVPAVVKTSLQKRPTTRTVLSHSGNIALSGIEVEIIATVSKAMNFYIDVYEPQNADVELWGQKQDDGKFTGLLGEMMMNKADFALGDLSYTGYHLDLMDLSVPYNTECLTFLTPESFNDISWMTLVLPFKPMMWMAVVLAYIVCTFLLFRLARIQRRFSSSKKREIYNHQKIMFRPVLNKTFVLRNEKLASSKDDEGLYLFEHFPNSALYTYGMLLVVSLPKLPIGWSLRMFTGWMWLFCTLVVVSYRASMTAILANPAPKVTIDNLEELADSKLAVGGWGKQTREFFLTFLDPAGQKIGHIFETVSNSRDAILRVGEGRFAYYENVHYLKKSIVEARLQRARKNSVGQRAELHVMSDCVINMPISVGLQKNSPLKPNIDKYVRRVIEAGLIAKWMDDVMRKILRDGARDEEEEIAAVMDFRKFSGAVFVLVVGYALAMLAFVVENGLWYRKSKRMKVERHPPLVVERSRRRNIFGGWFSKISKPQKQGHAGIYKYLKKCCGNNTTG